MPKISFFGIEIYIPDLTEIINAVTTPITNVVWSAVQNITTTLTPLFNTVWSVVSGVTSTITTFITTNITGLVSAISNTLGSVWTFIQTIPSTVSGVLGPLIEDIGAGVQSVAATLGTSLNNLGVELGAGLEGLGSSLVSVIDTIGPTVETMFNGAFGLVGDVMGGLFTGFGSLDIGAAVGSTQVIAAGMGAVLEAGPLMSSPMTPEDARANTDSWRSIQRDHWYQMYIMALGIEGGSLGQVEAPITMMFREPQIAASLDLATSWFAAPYEIGIRPLLERYWLKSYQPLLPAYADMIDVYVKEGYLAEKWVELPDEFVANMTELGYSLFWTQRLWGKHWVLPAVDHIYEMYARTLGTRPEIGVDIGLLRTMLKYHDYEPVWRDRFEAIIWRTWRIYDLRVGWEMNMYDHETLVKKTIDARYNPDEADTIADIQKMFVLRSEIDGLLREADTDFIDGWISEATLRADYEATPYRPEIQEMRIQRAILRRDRDYKKEIAAALKDRFIKGDLSESEYTTALSELGMVEDRISVAVERARAYKLKKVVEAA